MLASLHVDWNDDEQRFQDEGWKVENSTEWEDAANYHKERKLSQHNKGSSSHTCTYGYILSESYWEYPLIV